MYDPSFSGSVAVALVVMSSEPRSRKTLTVGVLFVFFAFDGIEADNFEVSDDVNKNIKRNMRRTIGLCRVIV